MALDALAGLLAPYTGGADPSLQSANPLLGLALSVAMSNGQQQVAPLGSSPAPGSSPSGGGGVFNGPSGPWNFQTWAQRYTQPGVPENMLVSLKSGSYPATNNALWTRPDVAAAFKAASKAFHQDTGSYLGNYLVSAWRPFQSSSSKATSMRNSDHWLGGALDFAANSQADQWLRTHGGQFGFGNAGAGYNWGDPGHFSFTAGGFQGSHSASGSNWAVPTAADARWIQLARQLFG